MQTVIVNRYAKITKGVLKGQEGKVVLFDSEINCVGIQLDKDTIVNLPSENIRQYGDNTFYYLGKHFTPVEHLPENMSFQKTSRHLKSDRELGFCNYEWKKTGKDTYSHHNFYNACNNASFDLFRCEENNRIYIPGDNELFEYIL